MDTAAGSASIRKELHVEEVLLDDRHATPEEKQSAIAEAWMHASLQHRRDLQKDVRLRIAAAHRKLRPLAAMDEIHRVHMHTHAAYTPQQFPQQEPVACHAHTPLHTPLLPGMCTR